MASHKETPTVTRAEVMKHYDRGWKHSSDDRDLDLEVYERRYLSSALYLKVPQELRNKMWNAYLDGYSDYAQGNAYGSYIDNDEEGAYDFISERQEAE